jgi:hypothetical protein
MSGSSHVVRGTTDPDARQRFPGDGGEWMAPLLVTALVGIGVKIATDLLAAGAKQVFRSGGPSFEATLDKARATGAAETPGVRAAGLSMGLDDRSRVLAAAATDVAGVSPAHGFASYRLHEVLTQAP